MLKLKSILASVMVFVCCTGFVSAGGRTGSMRAKTIRGGG